MKDRKVENYKKNICLLFVLISLTASFVFSGVEAVSADNSYTESSRWFRKYGDYLLYLTVQRASPRAYTMSVFSDKTAFETSIGKRLRIGSLSDKFHWGIEFGLFTSL
ncbi:MAG: hypothetical protein PVH84_16740, partial [Candidatus Aminicenantes bacterium]